MPAGIFGDRCGGVQVWSFCTEKRRNAEGKVTYRTVYKMEKGNNGEKRSSRAKEKKICGEMELLPG